MNDMNDNINSNMKDTLIVNLLRFGDIYATAHLINSMKSTDPTSRISILVWEEFEAAARNIKDIYKVYTIDRKKVLTYKKNEIYSDAFALETFYQNLQQVAGNSWSHIINYSNDLIAANITSYLENKSTVLSGITINNKMAAIPSSSWDIVFNDIATDYPYTPLHFVDCYHKMVGINRVLKGEKIKVNTKYNEIAFKNINEIRDHKKAETDQVKIVAIQLTTSRESKNIPYAEILKLIDIISVSKDYFPILLIAPTDEERNLANIINNEFNNELVFVESDFRALPSLLMNIDLLVTPDTVVKHIADLVETPIVEISLGHSPFLKQGTIGQHNIIITNNIQTRDFKSTENNFITALDIFNAVKVILENKPISGIQISHGVSYYRPVQDSFGTKYRHFAGDCPESEEISRQMARILIANIFSQLETSSSFNDLLPFSQKTLKEWIEVEKNAISLTVKDVLGTLRALHMAKENRAKASDFIKSLDKLFIHCDDHTLASIPCLLFRAKVEALNSCSFSENSKQIESLLFTIKDEIQQAYKCIKTLDQLTINKMTNRPNIAL